MKRVVLFVVMALLLVSFSSLASDKVVIQYWHAMSGPLGEAVERGVDAFNASQDRVFVEVEYKGSYRDTLNATIAAIRAGNPPHIIQNFEIATQQLIDMGLFLPLEDSLPEGTVDWDNDFLSPVVNYYRVDGKLYSMPYNSSNPIFFYNKDLFREAGLDPEKPPTTFEEVLEFSRQIQESGAAPHGIVWPLHSWFFEQWMANMGADLADQDNGRSGRATTVLLEDPAAHDIISWWNQLYQEDLWVNTGVENWSQSRQVFAAQRVAMTIDSTAATVSHLRAAEEQGFELGSGFLPIAEKYDRHGVTIGGGTLWIVDGHSQEETEAAGEFVVFLSRPQSQADWHKGTGYFPVHVDAMDILEDEGWFDDNPIYGVAVDQLMATKNITATQGALFGNFPEIRTIITDAIQQILQGDKTVEQALADAKTTGEARIHDYNRVIGVN